ncbi:hypothetical protein CHK_0114 [Christensenella hongkongensis]|uniref:Uncharacterized protein n=1 Tax=Christensenella hongkongensis TaxID=270498 RepID=A0A0M2NII4_9FIRM|nr:hypothetical protein CHK_0114 [Christensenella hongkongensis]
MESAVTSPLNTDFKAPFLSLLIKMYAIPFAAIHVFAFRFTPHQTIAFTGQPQNRLRLRDARTL